MPPFGDEIRRFLCFFFHAFALRARVQFQGSPRGGGFGGMGTYLWGLGKTSLFRKNMAETLVKQRFSEIGVNGGR